MKKCLSAVNLFFRASHSHAYVLGNVELFLSINEGFVIISIFQELLLATLKQKIEEIQ